MNEKDGRYYDTIIGNQPMAPKPPAEPKVPTPFPERALRDKPGEAPLIPDGSL